MSERRVTITGPRGSALAAPERMRAWVALMKPRIIELLLITTVPAMVLAEGGWPDTWLVVATVIGGSLSAGGANAINNVVDRDVDAKMRRTAHRPLPAHRVGPKEALVVGFVAGTAGFAILALAVNLAAALLATGALAFYVLVYSLILKRSTAQNIVIGGAAGAVPVLVGTSHRRVPWHRKPHPRLRGRQGFAGQPAQHRGQRQRVARFPFRSW